MKKIITSFLFLVLALVVNAQIDGNDLVRMGYLRQALETKAGIMVSNNRFSEIYLVQNGELKTMVSSRGCGLYSKTNKTKDLVGFKSINDEGEQAPAILDVKTGKVTLLESYTFQCGQVSFSNDGTVAYTMGEDLIIRKGNEKKRFSLGFYTNLTEISPDATKVAYTNMDGEMFVIDLTTGVSSQITSNNMYNPQWSADGTKLSVEKIDGHINVYDFAKACMYQLGEGTEARWANNSNYLVYTDTEKENEFIVHGTSIKKVRFDGAERSTLVSDIESCPMGAIVLSDNSLLVPYSLGEKRGLRKIAMDSRLRAKANSSETLLAIPANQKIGRNFTSFRDKAVKANCEGLKKANLTGGEIGILDIPYINQVWDTPPSHEGCTSYGYVACAPSSSCMLLGYYGLVKKHPVQSRASGVGMVDYSWYVGREYTSTHTGYNFDMRHTGNGCPGVAGGYGFMWGYGSPASMMADFYKKNGVRESFFENGWNVFDREVSNGFPYTICLKNSTNGHVVLGFRTNAQVRDKKVSYIAGSFVCHDPYGDYNGANYPNWDGRYSTYDWPGYNNGWANINVFYWGCVARHNINNKYINPGEENMAFGSVQSGTTKTMSLYVGSIGLTSEIKVSCDNSVFQLSATSLPKEGGELNVTFKPNAMKSYTGTITLTSDGAGKEKVTLSGKGTGKSFDLKQVWNFGGNNGIDADGQTWLSKETLGNMRNMAFGYGKLYVTFNNNSILVLDGKTGKKLRELNNAGVNGGVIPIADCKYVDGKIIASSISSKENGDALKVYVWDNDEAATAPKVLLNTTDFGSDVTRIGDYVGIKGDVNNGTLYFAGTTANATVLVKYKITNGTCSATPTVINLVDGTGKAMNFGVSTRIIPNADGKFWADGRLTYPTLFTAEGKFVATLNADAVGGTKDGNAFCAFEYGGVTYGAATSYQRGRVTLKNCSFSVFDAIDGWAKSAKIGGNYPEKGLGAERNLNCASTLAVCPNGDKGFEIWVMAQNQGIALFRAGEGKDFASIEGVEADDAEECVITVAGKQLNIIGVDAVNSEIYSISGAMVMRRANENVIDVNELSGLYIVVVVDEAGNRHVAKVII